MAPVTNKGSRGRSVAPPPDGVGRRVERKKAKLVGRNKGSLTERANEANSDNDNTDKKNIQNKQRECTEQLSRPNAQHSPETQQTSLPASSPTQNPA